MHFLCPDGLSTHSNLVVLSVIYQELFFEFQLWEIVQILKGRTKCVGIHKWLSGGTHGVVTGIRRIPRSAKSRFINQLWNAFKVVCLVTEQLLEGSKRKPSRPWRSVPSGIAQMIWDVLKKIIIWTWNSSWRNTTKSEDKGHKTKDKNSGKKNRAGKDGEVKAFLLFDH